MRCFLLTKLINKIRTEQWFNSLTNTSFQWVKKDPSSWLAENVPSKLSEIPKDINSNRIQEIAKETSKLGKLPLWEGYEEAGVRNSKQVSTSKHIGNFYSWLIKEKKPINVIEFGTAFGVSGMYWLSGIEQNKVGQLLTFEPNTTWASIAEKNLRSIGSRFNLTVGTFEDNIDGVLVGEIDFAFVDAIHTNEFVLPQFELVLQRISNNAIIVFDDINFSEDMMDCWENIATDSRVKSSLVFVSKIGIVEISPS